VRRVRRGRGSRLILCVVDFWSRLFLSSGLFKDFLFGRHSLGGVDILYIVTFLEMVIGCPPLAINNTT
jgi:hypothetical protein